MTVTTTLSEESGRQGAFYVPRYAVKIQGANLPRDVVYDVRELTYEDSVDAIDSFQMTVNNWDDNKRRFKYIGSETQEDLTPGSPRYGEVTLFEPCNKEVVVEMGYDSELTTMLKGQFTTMEPFYVDGAATLRVTGLNVLHQLRRKQYTTTWVDKRDSEIAKNIATLTDQGVRRFPLPIVVNDEALGREKPIPIVSQRNQYDIDFLFQRARARGYVLFIQEADPSQNRPRQLYFGPSDEGMIPGLRNVVFELEWGKSLIEFRPKITTANQVGSVTVRGWHRTRRTPISRTVTLNDERIRVNKDLHRMLNACDARQEMVVDLPVFTNCEARELAIAILLDQTKQMVTAEAKVIGLPDLRAGQLVVIGNLGARLSGTYFVTKTKHTINDDGYITDFTCRREHHRLGGTP
jgi:phage protein D